MADQVGRNGETLPRKVGSRKSIAHTQSWPTTLGEDKENMTADVGEMTGMKRKSMPTDRPSKKSRSKSIGPGGVDGLKEAARNQQKNAPVMPIKSILKPTIPLSPLREIPSYPLQSGSRMNLRSGTGASNSANRQRVEPQLRDNISGLDLLRSPVSVNGTEQLPNPFGTGEGDREGIDIGDGRDSTSRINVEQMREKELRDKEIQEALKRREARRKSLANRRVSFAPEATLHTWNVVEFIHDSTSSSGSTDPTRRASLLTGPQVATPQPPPHSPARSLASSDTPSTPPGQLEELQPSISPADQRNLHRRKSRRRSSDVTSLDAANASTEGVLSSPFSATSGIDSDDISSQSSFIIDEDGSANGSSDSAEGESTSMSLDSGVTTLDSFMSMRSSNHSNASSVRLEEALRQAAAQAGTPGIEYDENGDLSMEMEMANDQVTAAFQPWVKHKSRTVQKLQDLTSAHDQENQNPFSPAFRRAVTSAASLQPPTVEDDNTVGVEDEEGFSMEMTRAVGGILLAQQESEEMLKSTSSGPTQRRKSVNRRHSSTSGEVSIAEESTLEDATMDLTMAIGGIQQEAETPIDQTTPSVPSAVVEEPLTHTSPNQAEPLDSPASIPRTLNSQEEGSVIEDVEASTEQVVENIRLEEFLDLVGIQFMDLTASKRRIKEAAGIPELKNRGDNEASQESNLTGANGFRLEDYVTAAACTLPLLEMYQHSCRELKRYISEGRNVMRQIEIDTYEHNPVLFHAYKSASADMQYAMDNQFKNLKTYARLSSKAMWYEWREKLLQDLKKGLLKVADNMSEDDKTLSKQEGLLATILPRLTERNEQLRLEKAGLQAQADEIANCDQAELGAARATVIEMEKEIHEAKAMIAQLQNDVRARQQAIEAATERKLVCLEDIKNAERIKEECRGWRISEVTAAKDIADALEANYGWAITGAVGTTLTMVFRSEVQLTLDVVSFLGQSASSDSAPLSLSYTESDEARNSGLSQTVKGFFVGAMASQIQKVQCASYQITSLLRFVSDSWGKALVVAEDLRMLNLIYPTRANVDVGNRLNITSTVLLPGLCSKMSVSFRISLQLKNMCASVDVEPLARLVYGKGIDEVQVQEYLNSRVSGHVSIQNVDPEQSWRGAVEGLANRLCV